MPKIDESELLPCPFCGTDDDLTAYTDGACCGNCGARGPTHLNSGSSTQTAKDDWNRRATVATTPQPDALKEALRETAHDYAKTWGVTVERALVDALAERAATFLPAPPQPGQEVREALTPFAVVGRLVDRYFKSASDKTTFQSGAAWTDKDGVKRTLTLGDFRRAASALSANPQPADGALRAACEQARDQFRFYEAEHLSARKLEKAETNGKMADMLEAALAASPAPDAPGQDTP